MKIIYMGTSEFAAAPLKAIYENGHEICAVVTQPDKPNSRRGKQVVFSPVKAMALSLGINVIQPDNVSEEALEYLQSFNADVNVVCSYGQLLKKDILESAKHGSINIHASLLPKYRGAAPIQRCIMDGCKITGVSIMYMDEGLDTGDVMITGEVPVPENMTGGQLEDNLSSLGCELILKALEYLDSGKAPRAPQGDKLYRYANKITKKDCEIDFYNDANTIHNQIRALSPSPGAYTYLGEKRVNICDSSYINKNYGTEPGVVAEKDNEGIIIGCQSGAVKVITLKPQDKKLMSAKDFLNGLRGEKIKLGRY